MTEPIESYEHAGVPVEIHYDEPHESPREWCNVSMLYCWDERMQGVVGEGEHDEMFSAADHDSLAEAVAHLIERGAKVIVPLYLLDHSGYALRSGANIVELDERGRARACESAGRFVGDGAGWDTSMVGFAWTNEERLSEIGAPDALEAVTGEMSTLDDYFRGEVYGFVVAPGTDDEESCWDFYGMDDVKCEASRCAEALAESRQHERDEQRRWAERDVMTEVVS